ncbi:hypothetical protein HWV62_55 [Athelia sp. TMB]|nr:hypothetical protein HWV62_55 [Athelia sp. TMB]
MTQLRRVNSSRNASNAMRSTGNHPAYYMLRIPKPPSDSQASDFAALRLLALKSDPSSFSSTYEREVAYTPDQWKARLSAPESATFVLSYLPSVERAETEWIGTVSVLIPSHLTFKALEPLRGAGVGKGGEIYLLVGMWVAQDHRGRGLGKKLVHDAMEWVRDHADAEGIERAVLALQVSATNEIGRSLYIGMGFEPVPDAKDEHEWLTISMAR